MLSYCHFVGFRGSVLATRVCCVWCKKKNGGPHNDKQVLINLCKNKVALLCLSMLIHCFEAYPKNQNKQKKKTNAKVVEMNANKNQQRIKNETTCAPTLCKPMHVKSHITNCTLQKKKKIIKMNIKHFDSVWCTYFNVSGHKY